MGCYNAINRAWAQTQQPVNAPSSKNEDSIQPKVSFEGQIIKLIQSAENQLFGIRNFFGRSRIFFEIRFREKVSSARWNGIFWQRCWYDSKLELMVELKAVAIAGQLTSVQAVSSWAHSTPEPDWDELDKEVYSQVFCCIDAALQLWPSDFCWKDWWQHGLLKM